MAVNAALLVLLISGVILAASPARITRGLHGRPRHDIDEQD